MNKSRKHSYDSAGNYSCVHDHAHPQSNEQTHQHKHEHDHKELFGQADEVPAVFSESMMIQFKEDVSGQEVKTCLASCIESLKQWASKNKCFIGHIKVFVEGEDCFSLWLSTTGKDINVTSSTRSESHKLNNCTVNITAIVFDTDEQTLSSFIKYALPESFNKLPAESILPKQA